MRLAVAIFGGLGIFAACSNAPAGADTVADSDSDSAAPEQLHCRVLCPASAPVSTDLPLTLRISEPAGDLRYRITTDGTADSAWQTDSDIELSDVGTEPHRASMPNPGPGTWLVESEVRVDLRFPRFFPCTPNRGDVCPNVPTPPPADYDPERHVVFVVEHVDTDTDTDDTDGP